MAIILGTPVGHFFASSFHDILIGASSGCHSRRKHRIDAVAVKVEEVTAAVSAFYPPAIAALEIERLSVFALGAGCALLKKYGSADAAAKAQPDISPDLWTQLEQLLMQYPQLTVQAEQIIRHSEMNLWIGIGPHRLLNVSLELLVS